MPKKSKGKKGKKGAKGKMRKFDLDLFGAPFEEFMYTPEKKKGAKPQPAKGKKKKKKPVEVPKLMKFPPVPEDPAKIRKLRAARKKKDPPDAIVTTMNLGYPEYTTRPRIPLQSGGSLRDVICKKKFPILPRPQPHGGVYANVKCVLCASTGGLLKTIFGMLHKKMRKLLNNQFEKARFIIEWFTTKMRETTLNYNAHVENVIKEIMGPVLDGLDESEFEDHQNVRAIQDKLRQLQRELDLLRQELKQFRKNRDEEIAKRLADKVAELEEAERQMMALEAKVKEAEDMLADWQQNSLSKIEGPKEEIRKVMELLQKIKDSIILERDTLRVLLGWEMKIATEKTVAKMEEIISADLDVVQGWMHSAWFRLFLENRRMQEERSRLRIENHLLDLEVEALTRQVGQMEANKKEIVGTRTYFITPPSLHAQVDKFTKTVQYPESLELWDYPPTRLVHE
ncbi:unnamed protein product [Orchesella dallaii]|uniref:Uncharacterized protein n=1 Tax=Orchesella dallaii TaxID=48710 RepID=A0ABP1PP35_9HEXA